MTCEPGAIEILELQLDRKQLTRGRLGGIPVLRSPKRKGRGICWANGPRAARIRRPCKLAPAQLDEVTSGLPQDSRREPMADGTLGVTGRVPWHRTPRRRMRMTTNLAS
jgi:hypothetical protein